MAPRRGGGSSSSGSSGYSSSGSDSSYDSGSDSGYDTGETDYSTYYNGYFSAICAELAFSSLVLVAALVAAGMVLSRSWIRDTGSRNLPRLLTFLLLLTAIIVSRALTISWLAPSIMYFNDGGIDELYSPNQSIAGSFFSLCATILLFTIAVIELYGGPGIHLRKTHARERANYVIIGLLLVLILPGWAVGTAETLQYLNYSSSDTYDSYSDSYAEEDYIYNMQRALQGIDMTYSVLSVLFATGLLIRSFAISLEDAVSELRKRYLLLLVTALWLGQILDLAATALSLFSADLNSLVSIAALVATSEFFWVVKLIAIALLAWESAKLCRNGRVTSMATDPAAQPPMADNTWQKKYSTTDTVNTAASTDFRPSAGAP